ncbi:MAG: helix-turn-helix transcriptional regulator [Rhizobacter sp.]|nr:helix-turn-helix transcriptional regulator [Rhizobacter sp.]
MPNVASILKQEIARVARKQVRSETAPLRKASAGYRSDIAALKRRVAETERQLRVGAKSAPRAAPAANDDAIPEGMRFSAKGLAGHRKRLGLSANELGLLLGVSGQTIYNWESGKARPNRKFLPTLAAMRSVGKKETAARLEELKSAA